MTRIRACLAVLWVAGLLVSATRAQDINDPRGDFGKELPRVPALSPADSLQSLRVADGFRVELAAHEPQVHDPVAVDFDEQGRMYVVQLPPYNAYVVEGFRKTGSIALLEDRDEDGKYEHSVEFATNLRYPTAVACWQGGVLVGDAPDLLYLKDTDGDGKADERRVLLTGFGTDKAGEAHLNSIRWGLDARFHFSTSLSGGDVGAPGASTVSVRNRGVILDPRTGSFELTSGGGQHGMSMDDWGRKFVCSNSVPAQLLIYDDRYVARNPWLQSPAAAVDIAPDNKFTELFRISPPEPWRVLRTRLRKEGKFRGSDEGGKPFGFFTGATGVTIYRGDAWPKSHRGNLLVGDVANNLVYRASLADEGLSLVARRADPGAEFLASSDIWFRPVQMANAPDGTLLVLDMNRELIEGAAFLPPEFLKHLDAVSGSDRGRIYRIAPASGPLRRQSPRLGKMSSKELIGLLEHENGWHRDTASRLLFERLDEQGGDVATITELRRVARESLLDRGRAAAMGLLGALGKLDEAEVLAALNAASAELRVFALQCAEPLVGESAALRARLPELADDPSARVRYQLAFSLGAFLSPGSVDALAQLARRDGADRWMQLAILSSCGTAGPTSRQGPERPRGSAADALFRKLAADTAFRRSDAGRVMLVELAREIGQGRSAAALAVVLGSMSDIGLDDARDRQLNESLVKALVEKQHESVRQQVLAARGGNAAEILRQMLNAAQATLADDKAELPERLEAVRSLRSARFAEVRELLAAQLRPSQPQSIQAAAVETIAGFDDADVPTVLLAAWPGLSPAVRLRGAEVLLSRTAWLHRFLDAVESGPVSRGDLDPSRVQLLKQHPDERVTARVEKLFATAGLTARSEVARRYQPSLELTGDAMRGKAVFKKNCSACHQLEGVGATIGADLRGIAQRGLPSVLLNILDPNREVKPKFLTYVVRTEDGQVLSGMITAESANSITLRQADGTDVAIQRLEIQGMKSTGLSFMPEGLEKNIDLKAMSDLLAYLGSM
ncbi:MAG: c-type cytochrome [Planctomycetales bacterium]|nr:c-type cytochrome [Planctomycetales bacterium]